MNEEVVKVHKNTLQYHSKETLEGMVLIVARGAHKKSLIGSDSMLYQKVEKAVEEVVYCRGTDVLMSTKVWKLLESQSIS